MINQSITSIGRIGSLEITVNAHMTEGCEAFDVRRTLRERLFTLPWRPPQATKTVVLQVPRKDYIKMGNRIIGHPEAIAELMRQIEGCPSAQVAAESKTNCSGCRGASVHHTCGAESVAR